MELLCVRIAIKIFIVNMDTPHVFYEDKDAREPFVAYDLMRSEEWMDAHKYSAPEIKTIEILCEQCIMTGSLGNPGADPDINDWGEF